MASEYGTEALFTNAEGQSESTHKHQLILLLCEREANDNKM